MRVIFASTLLSLVNHLALNSMMPLENKLKKKKINEISGMSNLKEKKKNSFNILLHFSELFEYCSTLGNMVFYTLASFRLQCIMLVKVFIITCVSFPALPHTPV